METLWCNIKPSSGSPFLLGCIYRPPSSNIQCFNKIIDNIEKAISLNENIVILGDFNIDVSDCNHPYNSKYQSMCDLFDLTQLVKEPTRVTADTSSTIDLILTSIPSRMYGTRVIKNTMSDHYVINVVINSRIKATHKLITCRTYKNFVETSFISELSDASTDFNINMDCNIDELWQIFKMKFLSVANTHAPYRSFRAKGSSVPWVSHDIVSLI